MTAQVSEILMLDGKCHEMCAQPLSDYFMLAGINPQLDIPHTACWRGYVGTWEIIHERLYLTELSGRIENGACASLETFFPGYPTRVFAHWFDGRIRLPRGKLLKYMHMGFASVHEEDVFLVIKRGIVVRSWVECNGVSDDPTAPDGYGPGAWTTSPATTHEGEAP